MKKTTIKGNLWYYFLLISTIASVVVILIYKLSTRITGGYSIIGFGLVLIFYTIKNKRKIIQGISLEPSSIKEIRIPRIIVAIFGLVGFVTIITTLLNKKPNYTYLILGALLTIHSLVFVMNPFPVVKQNVTSEQKKILLIIFGSFALFAVLLAIIFILEVIYQQ